MRLPIFRPAAALILALGSVFSALADEAAPTLAAPEPISLGQTLGILFFLALAALIVLSILCQLLLALGLAPHRKSNPVRRVMVALASVVSKVSVTRSSDSGSSSSRSGSGTGGGGSFGGGGASGNW